MTKDVIKKYGINFQNRIDDGVIDKVPDTHLDYLTFLLYEWNAFDIDDSDHGLLADIDEALLNPDSEIESGSSRVDIIIYQNVVNFYPDGNDEIYSMPTIDFREIVIEWRNFLLTPPLNNTKIWLSPINICRLAISYLNKIFQNH